MFYILEPQDLKENPFFVKFLWGRSQFLEEKKGVIVLDADEMQSKNLCALLNDLFIVHFFIGHLRPSSFPMNEGMFSGSVPMEEAMAEKPAWIARLKEKGKLEALETIPSATWYRVIYYVSGYAVLIFGVYLLINGIVYRRYISLYETKIRFH